MPSITRGGVRTHYELAGSGPPALLIHAFSGNHTSWVGYGFVERLAPRHQLILPDLRGHGASDGPATPAAYRLEELVEDMAALLEELGAPPAHVLGYSMGGIVGYGLAQRHPRRVRSLAAGGASPYLPTGRSTRSFLLGLYERAAAEGVETLVEGIRQWAGAISPEYEARLRAANVAAGAALLRQVSESPPDFTDWLPAAPMPCLLYGGTADDVYGELERAAAALPGARLIALPGMNHVQAAGASAELAPELLAFWAAAESGEW